VSTFRLGTFSIAGCPPFPGLVIAERVYAIRALEELTGELGQDLKGAESILGLLDSWDHNLPALESIVAALCSTTVDPVARRVLDTGALLSQLRIHAPVQARQIFQAGANYHQHVVDLIVDGAVARDPSANKEQVRANATDMMRKRAATGRPFVFMGLWSSVIGPYDPIVVPYDVEQPDWELELAAVIGRPARRVSREEALAYVAGYTVANDITSRELVSRPDVPQMGMDWIASKGTPTFLPIGPFITPSAFAGDPQALQVTLRLNGQIMQDESTADMIFCVARLIEFISMHVQLLPGDLVLTGSPAGNGTHYNRYIRDGDLLEGEISGLGALRNPCIAERRPK
jgi:2-keto-4-pentenoate hydratase/2-oxohepta-3-ene-1,7-dioic acid hydratase in catechol pathway